MPTYKLTYFNFTARAEPIRFLLSYLNVDFEDNRFEIEQWPSIKPTLPFGKAPILEIDDKVLNQTTAIARYLSKKAGLAGRDDWESLLIDMAVDNFNDFIDALASYVYDSNQKSKAKKHLIMYNETIPFYMDKFENLVIENQGHFVNGKLSWADFFFASTLDYLAFKINVELLEGRPNLQALKKKVFAIPQIKSWIAKRPQTADITHNKTSTTG